MNSNEQYNNTDIPNLPSVVEPTQQPDNKMKIKLYRDTDDVMIGGVCSGLAYRFHMSVMLVRALTFIAGLFALYVAIIAYLCIWLIVPKAITVAQKLEMRGLPPNPQTIHNFKSYEVQHGCLYSGISIFLKMCIFLSLIALAFFLFKRFMPV